MKIEDIQLFVFCAVLGAPRNLQLTLTQDDPPMFQASWQAPRSPISPILGYRVQYGVRGTDHMETKDLDAERYRFTTTFLGLWYSSLLLCHIITVTNIHVNNVAHFYGTL